KTHFLSAISHDLRTPVNAINLMAELFRRSAANPALAADLPGLAQKLYASTAFLVELVRDLLDIARFDSGRMEFQESDFPLDHLLEDECQKLLPLAQAKGVQLLAGSAGPPVRVRADRIKLARALDNLIGNAVKFTLNGSICVGAAPGPDGRLHIHVADTGPGIAREHLETIFDEFTQLNNPERDRGKGPRLAL